ncbi:hypothetical protein B0H14DRAFT_2994479 [Mycena olivaceomarginata]|nr:hypothetical protein B0H14DRAFT_2994479 [Mycena olivaceomarginata]
MSILSPIPFTVCGLQFLAWASRLSCTCSLEPSRNLRSRYPGRLQLALHLLQLIRFSNLACYRLHVVNSTYCTLSSFCPLDSRLTWSIFRPVRTGRSENEVW